VVGVRPRHRSAVLCLGCFILSDHLTELNVIGAVVTNRAAWAPAICLLRHGGCATLQKCRSGVPGGQKSRLASGAKVLTKFCEKSKVLPARPGRSLSQRVQLTQTRCGPLTDAFWVCYNRSTEEDAEWEAAMQEKGSVIAFCAVTASVGAAVFVSSSARALPLAGYSVHGAGIHQATTTQKARYICRGSRRHRCYYISRPEQTTRDFSGYYRSGWNGM
jgi:hypothetical protein